MATLTPPPAPGASHTGMPWLAASATALAYLAAGALGLLLAGPPGYASPLYPSAGIALAAVLVYGNRVLPGVFVGAFLVNAGLGLLRGEIGLSSLLLPLLVAAGASLQAAVAARLVRRFVAQPVVLNAPRDVMLFGLLGGAVGCLVSAVIGTLALLGAGAIGPSQVGSNALVWWMGDTLGVLIGAPLVLTLIGRPRADWAPRRRTLSLPLLLALALVGAGSLEFNAVNQQRIAGRFERDADRLASAAAARLAAPEHALQALHSSARARGAIDRETLRQASRWWLAQPSLPLQAMGYSERVAVDDVASFEAGARAQGLADFAVFDRDDGSARSTDREVVALRLIEPLRGNAAALGVNVLSIPAARKAIVQARDSGEPATTAGFGLTQSAGDETGVVMYQALYRGDPGSVETRRAAFAGLVFVTLRTDAALAEVATRAQSYLNWCLVDSDPGAERQRLAGAADCEQQPADQSTLRTQRRLSLAGRPVELRIRAQRDAVPGTETAAAGLLAIAGLAAASLLGALLLIVTGHSRRTELAVVIGTDQLRREITERVQVEGALRESEARLRSILDHVPLGVMFLDPQGYFIDCNPRLCEMLGVKAVDVPGRLVTEFVPREELERIRDLRRQLLETGTDGVIDRLRLRCADGQELTVQLTASPLRGSDGSVVRMVGVLEDITESLRLEQSEQALHRAEAANRAKSEFLSRMSHELRTPLNAMIGFAQLLGLDREPALAVHQREWAQEVQRAGWHLLEMINETLDLARIESGTVEFALQPVALTPMFAACRAMLAGPASQRGVVLEVVLDPDAGAVMADSTRLKQVLTNLLSNAVKYNRDGGRVTLTARRVAAAAGERIEIAVADNGLGMTPAQLTGLFQPYNRLGREASGIEGTGIGLVISRRLSELMGGTLEVASAADKGSIFTLNLAAAALAEPAAPHYSDTSPAPYQGRRVRYVEDNLTNVEVMRGILAQRPQVEMQASTLGLDGLAAIRAERPDLILLDMQLPDISGLELLRHLKHDAGLAGIPVIVVSADATPDHMQQALTLGALHYVTKPIDVARFLEMLDLVLLDIETQWGM